MIASYIQPVEGQTVDDWELRRHLSSRLPAHMFPARSSSSTAFR